LDRVLDGIIDSAELKAFPAEEREAALAAATGLTVSGNPLRRLPFGCYMSAYN